MYEKSPACLFSRWTCYFQAGQGTHSMNNHNLLVVDRPRLASFVSLHWIKQLGFCCAFYVTNPADYHSNRMVTCCFFWTNCDLHSASYWEQAWVFIVFWFFQVRKLPQDTQARFPEWPDTAREARQVVPVHAESQSHFTPPYPLQKSSRFQKWNFLER